MNTDGISSQRLDAALSTPAVPGTSPGTINFVGAGIRKASLDDLHKKSRYNRSSLAKSKICGCFYCFSEFPFEQIVKWTDDNETALCPCCSVDAVLDFDSAGADQELLQWMHERWFKTPRRLTSDEWKNAVESNVWPSDW
jgi:hypothetical protein